MGRLRVRQKLVLLSLAILVAVSFAFTFVQLHLTRRLVEEDLQERAVMFAREVAATIGDERELHSPALLERQLQQVLAVRHNVLQLDIFSFARGRSEIVATSNPQRRLAVTRRDVELVRRGQVVSRLIESEPTRYWEVIAPISLEGAVAGAVAAKFSTQRADALAARTRAWALALTGASVVTMALLMSLAVRSIVTRPIERFMAAMRASRGDTLATVDVRSSDEFGALARHFNEMAARLHDFGDELQARVMAATHELEGRYREVERLNELLFTLQRSLGQAERLAISGRIMAEVAHEVGTPLHSVAGHLQLVRRDLPAALLADGLGRRLDVIEQQLARVTGIIAQLLDLTRRDPGPPAPVDLNRLVADLTELVRPRIVQRGLILEVDSQAGLPPVTGQSGQLQQVVLNLLTNAIDATQPGGRIRVATRSHPEERLVELAISDTGRGIPAAEQQHIFEPFFSTKGAGRGTGLGLFISAQVVREHRGRIHVASEPGRGATFSVRLPAGKGA